MLAGFLALLAGAAATPSLPTRAQLKACPALADLDFARIRAAAGQAGRREALDARHARTRGPLGTFAAPADALVSIRLWAGPGETQEQPTETSSVVWKVGDGVWRVDRVDYITTRDPPPRPPPPPGADSHRPEYAPQSQAEYERLKRDVIHGPLEPEQAAAIERALADPCFALQPDSMPFDPPVRRGRPPREPCSGVIGGTVEIIWADGRRREVTELCGGFYARALIEAVMYARTAR
ncbi:MAG: hypothetical protein QOH04_2845 [Sphingomonadales bacterium]|jgi:hypothetical protein|nr:hypothetical protein [Sphingomonadales bacterium]